LSLPESIGVGEGPRRDLSIWPAWFGEHDSPG
jgi:hypothetical protein